MTKFKTTVLVLGILVICIAASLATFLVLSLSGAIVTEPYQVEFNVKDRTKTYDGTPLVPNDLEMVSGELTEGHVIVPEFTGSQTEAGVGFGSMTLKILDGDGFDVTDEYSIKINNCALTVNPATLLVRLDKSEAVYSGQKVMFDDYTIVSGELAQGHRLGAQKAGAGLINVDDVLSGADAYPIVLDASGRDMTKNYTVMFSMFDVKITPRPITVRPVEVQKVYDGTPLIPERYEIVSGSLASGQYMTVNYEVQNGDPSLTQVGERDVACCDVKICDVNGTDVTSNYQLRLETAKFKVLRRDITVTAKSGEREFDGSPFSLADDDKPYSVNGLVAGETVTVSYSGAVTGVGEAENIIEECTVSGGNENYDISLVAGKLKVTPKRVKVSLNPMEKVYDGQPFGAQESELYDVQPALPQGFAFASDAEERLGEFINAGNFTYSATEYAITDGDGNDVTDCFTVTLVPGRVSIARKEILLSIKAADYGKVYDGAPFAFDKSHVSASGIVEGHVVGSVECEKLVEAGSGVCSLTAISFTDGDGIDVTANYSFSLNVSAMVTITKRALSVTTGSASKIYDGSSLTSPEVTVLGLAYGDYIKLASQAVTVTDAGEEKNSYEYSILNSDGVSVSDSYETQENFGTLTVLKKTLYVKVGDITEEYSGTQLEQAKLKRSLSGYEPLSSDSFTVQGAQAEAGEYELTANYNEGEEGKNYTVIITPGKLIITPKPVTVTVRDYTVQYTGSEIQLDKTKLITGNYNLLGENALEKFQFENSGFTDAGTYGLKLKFTDTENKNYDVKITDGVLTITKKPLTVGVGNCVTEYTGNAVALDKNTLITGYDEILGLDAFEFINSDFTDAGAYVLQLKCTETNIDNYELTLTDGLLTITKKRVTVTLGEGSKTYDGAPLKLDSVNYQPVAGLNLKVTGSDLVGKTDAGEYDYTATFAVMDGTTDKTYNYDISVDSTLATYTINQCGVTLAYNGITQKTYDGKPFAVNPADITVSGLAGVTVTVTEIKYNSLVKVVSHEEPETGESGGTLTIIDAQALTLTSPKFAINGVPVSSANFTASDITVGVTINRKKLSISAPQLTVKEDTELNIMFMYYDFISPLTPLAEGDSVDENNNIFIASPDFDRGIYSVARNDGGIIVNDKGENVTNCYDIPEYAMGALVVVS